VIRKTGGKDAGKGYSIKLKDVDTAVMRHMMINIRPTVKEANEIIKVPVVYGNEERWKSVRSRSTLRDSTGALLLPVIVVKRTGVAYNDELPMSFDHDIRNKFVSHVKLNQWSNNNRYDRFAVLTGQKPVMETIKTGMPDFINATYDVAMMTNYIEQMNGLTELMLQHLKTYFGDSTSYKFLSDLEGDISDASTMESQGERFIRSDFSMSIKGYILPEFTKTNFGKKAELSKEFIPKKVSFSEKII
tara:strand:+ start:93 stop:830 length:738 start_codon:yes stop_codon:yes gene_type:complete